MGMVPDIEQGRRPSDPWAHRSSLMTCKSCMWYVRKEAPQGLDELGRCRKRSPTMDGFPAVFPTDWCGDHKLDETKIGRRA